MAENDRLDDETLLQRMGRLNPWWKTRSVPACLLKEFKRRDYSTLNRYMDEPLAQSILGARQVGKMTMVYQLISEVLSSGADPRRIVFLTLDGQGIAHNSESLLRMIDLYANSVIREPLSALTKKVYVIIGEVQLIKGWQSIVRQFFDQAWPVKFIVSGSSAAEVFGGSSEPPAGRVRHQTLAAMSFAEYVMLKDGSHSEALMSAGREMRAGLDESVKAGSALPFYDSVRHASLRLAAAKDHLLAHLADYMQYGGYPKVAGCDDPIEKAAAIKACIDLSLHKDAIWAATVKRPDLLNQLFYNYAWKSPRMISRDKVSRNLGISRDTVGVYSDILQRTFLTSYSDFYTGRPYIRHRRDRKVYVNDVGVRNVAAMVAGTDPIDDPTEAGMMAETVAADHTRRLWQSLAPASIAPMPHFWHSGGGAEVDLVIKLRRRPIPIGVEYRRHVEESDLKGLSRFSDKFDPPVALAVSRNESRLIGGKIVAVPMWLYLCMC